MGQPEKYSMSFKLQVVEEVTSGKLSQSGAQRKYGIGGNTTVSKWIKKFSTLETKLPKEVLMEKEIDKLKREKQELETALAQAHLKILTLESTVEVLEESRQEKLKKKSETSRLKGVYINRKGDTK